MGHLNRHLRIAVTLRPGRQAQTMKSFWVGPTHKPCSAIPPHRIRATPCAPSLWVKNPKPTWSSSVHSNKLLTTHKVKPLVFTQGETGTTSLETNIELFLIHWGSPAPDFIRAGTWQTLTWSTRARRFLAGGPAQVLSLDPGGSFIPFDHERYLIAAPNNQWLAGYAPRDQLNIQPGLRWYLSTGELLDTLTDEPIEAATWQPDSGGILFISGDQALSRLISQTSTPTRLQWPAAWPRAPPGLGTCATRLVHSEERGLCVWRVLCTRHTHRPRSSLMRTELL